MSAALVLAAALVRLAAPRRVPIDLGRDEAAALARAELAKPVYAEQRPPLWQRVLTWLIDQVGSLLSRAAQAAPGGWWGLLVLALAAAAVVVLVRWRGGAAHRRASVPQPLFVGRVRSASEHRSAAEAFAARGAFDDAVRECFRAVVRGLEERGLLDERAGRTADEAAADAGRVLPDCAGDLRAGARTFDDVVYGGHPAGRDTYQRLRELDDAVAAARPVRILAVDA